MRQILVDNPLLTIFLVVALGAVIGAVRIGPIRFGAAGALFVGLAFSAFLPELGEGMALLQGIGLALFVYTVGLSSGQSFFANFKQQKYLIGAAAVVIALGAAVAVGAGNLLQLNPALKVGLFTGALTAAPALDTASRITKSTEATVGFALAYPVAVVISIVIVTVVVRQKWSGKKDSPSLAGIGLYAVTAQIAKHIPVRSVAGWKEQTIRLSYLLRKGHMRVVSPGEDLLPGDQVVIVGQSEAVDKAAQQVGTAVDHHLADDRSDVVFEKIVISNVDLFGATVAELNTSSRFGGVITRVRRGDLNLLARDDLRIEPGDSLSVVVPLEELAAVQSYFGDSYRKVSEIDALTVGLGLVLGMLLGLVSIPLPGGQAFFLGPAAGPLVVGLLLGALRRTGPLVWIMPQAANLTIRQLGLLFFMAGLGLIAGPSFLQMATSAAGLRGGLLSILIVSTCCLGIVGAARLLGLSAPRAAGALAGILGQPAVLSCANSQVEDERIESTYAYIFAFSMVIKILLVPVIIVL